MLHQTNYNSPSSAELPTALFDTLQQQCPLSLPTYVLPLIKDIVEENDAQFRIVTPFYKAHTCTQQILVSRIILKHTSSVDSWQRWNWIKNQLLILLIIKCNSLLLTCASIGGVLISWGGIIRPPPSAPSTGALDGKGSEGVGGGQLLGHQNSSNRTFLPIC